VVAGSLIDTTFDVRTDAGGRDPDRYSTTLRRYHQQLWSKPLPSGAMFHLDAQLHHKSDLGEFWLSSDSIVHTYTRWVRPIRLVDVLARIPSEEKTAFYDLAYTVGAFLVFPVPTRADGKRQQSINQRRGTHHLIRDRFDLTLECIRRDYAGLDSPLRDVLAIHADFFNLFENFRGYIEHFLLQDLVSGDFASVRLLKDFDGFSGNALPDRSVEEYREYMGRSMAFIQARNERIATYATSPTRPAGEPVRARGTPPT
jgi:hypothetical protein